MIRQSKIIFRRLLIDTTDPDKPNYVSQLETVLGEENSTITNIIATHWHHDHIGSITDGKLKRLLPEDCKIWKFPRSDADEDYGNFKFLALANGQEFDLEDGTKLKVFHTPGHSTDHVILFDEATKAVYAGDCILGEGTAIFEDLYDYMKSLEFILSLAPSVIYPAHGDVINDPIERIQYYIDHRNQREKQILDALLNDCTKSLTAMQIVAIVYTTTPRHLWPAAAVNVNQHLKKLLKEGKVTESEKNGESYWQAATGHVANKL